MTTRISDIIVPESFTRYVQRLTEQKSRLIQSGAAQIAPNLSAKLAGGGLTYNEPFFNDLADDADNIASDDPTDTSTPNKITTGNEIQVRLSRNQSWKTMDLASALAGDDPNEAIAQRVANYWVRRSQAAFIATIQGVFADNAAAPAGSEHVQDDMTNDISDTFDDGVTNFGSAAFLNTTLTMGDSMEDLTLVMVHSVVYNRMQRLNLIDFIPDARGETMIPTYLGRQVIVDDQMPSNDGVYETWLFGAGAVQLGVGAPDVPTEVDRDPDQGNGSGAETLYSRVEWIIHPVGHAFVAGTIANGGPSNAATANNLANAASWQRVFPERKQIKIARLITREAPAA